MRFMRSAANKSGERPAPPPLSSTAGRVKSAEKAALYRPTGLRCRQENQRQKAPYPRRYFRAPASCDRASGRYSRPRWRHARSLDPVRHVSVFAKALRQWRISRAGLSKGFGQSASAPRNRNRQTAGSRLRLRGSHSVLLSNAPSPGSTDAGGGPRTLKISPAMPWQPCASPRSGSCSENSVINNQLSGARPTCASASPSSAALRYHFTASAWPCGTFHPYSYEPPMAVLP
jgi:hypothetical protein